MEDSFFSSMSRLNKIALWMFLLAKLCGIIGIVLGFFSGNLRTFGGITLGFAFVFLVFSVSCSILQSSKEAKKFEDEDKEKSILRDLTNKRKELENELKDLEARRTALLSFSVRHERKI